MNSSLKIYPQHFGTVKRAKKLFGIISKEMGNAIRIAVCQCTQWDIYIICL